MSIFRSLIDLVFPPFCVECSDYTDLKYLCHHCWEQSALLDLHDRCRHCFDEIGQESICAKCLTHPTLPFERAAVFDSRAPIHRLLKEDTASAAAGFAYYQWLRLDWKEPDLIVPIPTSRFGAAEKFAQLCNKPCVDLFHKIAWPLGTLKWEVRDELIEENSTVLLFDEGGSSKHLQLAAKALSTAFPKKVYLISLFLH